ncbi:MAG: flagellar protein FliS [Cellulosilyticaceae bacterium]
MITSATIANASQIELLCLTYEIFLEDIEEALQSSGKERKIRVDHAKEVLGQLVEGLNFELEMASYLFKLYIYMQDLLINKWEDDACMMEVHRLMTTIYEGYSQILKENQDQKPVMNNTENVYAGMTYGKGYLNEMVIGNEQRGFKA